MRAKFINESENIIEDIKLFLIEENDIESWEKFVDHQELGDCQGIVSSIVYNFPIAEKVFGEIEIDESYIDEYEDEQNLMTHHWVKIDNIIYDFSKGTLIDYIDFRDLYEVEIIDDWRYNAIHES